MDILVPPFFHLAQFLMNCIVSTKNTHTETVEEKTRPPIAKKAKEEYGTTKLDKIGTLKIPNYLIETKGSILSP